MLNFFWQVDKGNLYENAAFDPPLQTSDKFS